MFVRFTWGRSRLPRRLADFKDIRFTLQLLDKCARKRREREKGIWREVEEARSNGKRGMGRDEQMIWGLRMIKYGHFYLCFYWWCVLFLTIFSLLLD